MNMNLKLMMITENQTRICFKDIFIHWTLKQNLKSINFLEQLLKIEKKKIISINVKGRDFKIENFYDGIARFNFNELCDQNLGAEDYIEISKLSYLIVIEDMPNFNDNNSNQQQRFITLIDIFYEKKMKLLVSGEVDLSSLKSSKRLIKDFKRTISRLYELTSI